MLTKLLVRLFHHDRTGDLSRRQHQQQAAAAEASRQQRSAQQRSNWSPQRQRSGSAVAIGPSPRSAVRSWCATAAAWATREWTAPAAARRSSRAPPEASGSHQAPVLAPPLAPAPARPTRGSDEAAAPAQEKSKRSSARHLARQATAAPSRGRWPRREGGRGACRRSPAGSASPRAAPPPPRGSVDQAFAAETPHTRRIGDRGVTAPGSPDT